MKKNKKQMQIKRKKNEEMFVMVFDFTMQDNAIKSAIIDSPIINRIKKTVMTFAFLKNSNPPNQPVATIPTQTMKLTTDSVMNQEAQYAKSVFKNSSVWQNGIENQILGILKSQKKK